MERGVGNSNMEYYWGVSVLRRPGSVTVKYYLGISFGKRGRK